MSCRTSQIAAKLLEWFCRIFQIFRQQRKPFVEEFPVECAPCPFILGSVCKVFKINHIDERAYDCLVVF